MGDALWLDEEGDRPRRPRGADHPASDREVSLVPDPPAMSASVHAWLDGEATERAARRSAGDPEVDLWKGLMRDLAARRGRRTPAGLAARVMLALPD